MPTGYRLVCPLPRARGQSPRTLRGRTASTRACKNRRHFRVACVCACGKRSRPIYNDCAVLGWAPAAPMDCPLTRKHDSLFMLDYASRYVVQNCHAPEGVGTGLMSVAVLAPLWLWAIASAVHFAHGSTTTKLFSYGFTGTTLACWALIWFCARAPPVAGCGPSSAFPCPQAAIVGYTMFAHVWYDTRLGGETPITWRWAACAFLHVAVCQFAIASVLSLGFADGASVLAGAGVGAFMGASLLWEG